MAGHLPDKAGPVRQRYADDLTRSRNPLGAGTDLPRAAPETDKGLAALGQDNHFRFLDAVLVDCTYPSSTSSGFVVTASGQTATFTGNGTGRFTGPGHLTWRGALFYETTSDELSSLNGIAVVFEYQVADGKSEGRLFEWK